jgi:chemotaxis family two-component system response regulator Rcp1
MAYSRSEHQSCGIGRLKSPPSPRPAANCETNPTGLANAAPDLAAVSPPQTNFKTNPILDTKAPALAVGTALGILEAIGPKDAMKLGTKTATIKILVVEDNPGDLYLIRASLSLGEIPKQLSVVTNGEEALEFLSRSGEYHDAPQPDLILLDLNLPKVDGREVLERIKADPEWRHIPVVVLSTSTSESDVAGAYENHANCYLAKPHGVDEYLDIVHEIESYWLNCVALPSS